VKVAVLASLAVLAIAASGARAASPDASAAEVWRGRSCTPLGCGPGPRGSAVDAIVFGAAAFGSAWLARRRPR
jgi:hypothetical protein